MSSSEATKTLFPSENKKAVFLYNLILTTETQCPKMNAKYIVFETTHPKMGFYSEIWEKQFLKIFQTKI